MSEEKAIKIIFKDNSSLNDEEILDKMSFVLKNNAAEIILDVVREDPGIVLKNNYQLIKLICWVGNMELFDILIEYGGIDYFETEAGLIELRELGLFSSRIRDHIVNRINSKNLSKKLELDLSKKIKDSELIKI